MKYRSLNLEAIDYKKEGEVESFSVRVSESPVGAMTKKEAAPVVLPNDLRQRVRRLENRKLTLEEMIKLGEDLAAALFPPRLRPLLDGSRAALPENEGLRIRLMLDAYELTDLPWEYIYFANPDTPVDQKGVEGFLLFSRDVSILRDPVLEQRRGTFSPIPGQALRMVSLLSNPKNTPELNLAAEQQNIEKALRAVSEIKVQFYPNATIDVLEDALTDGAHIFHYSGHGGFEGEIGGQTGKGFLVLTDAIGGEEPFSAAKLAMSLAKRGIRVAMLGACESGRVDRVNAWSGIAPALMRAGIPAVVGMQFSVRDENAIAFSRSFYGELAAGRSIDEAVAAGRQSIFIRANDEDKERDWGAPVLYLRAEDGVIFPKSLEEPGPKPQPDPAIIDVLQKIQEELNGNPDYSYLKRRFEAILERISLLSDYKDLHDALHTIQYSLYHNIVSSTTIVMDDKYAKTDLTQYLRDYRREITKMKDAADDKNVDPEEGLWIAQLQQAGDDLEEGLDKANKTQIDSATQTINQVIGIQPTIINRKLYAAVYAYKENLPEPTDLMNKVRDRINAIAPESDAVKQFQKGIDSLKDINTNLGRLIAEHNTWQDVDNQLRMLPDLLEAGIAVFNKRWQSLRARIAPYYSTGDDKSSLRLKKADDSLGAAIAETNLDYVGRSFENYCSEASDRFFYVDKSVLELCEKLSLIRDELK